MILIGLTGYKRAGKDTVADYLVAEHGFTKLSMAAPLKAMLRKLDPFLGVYNEDDADMFECIERGCVCAQDYTDRKVRLSEIQDDWNWDEDELKTSVYGGEYRRLLQLLGTDCIRAIDQDFWVKAMVEVIEESGADRIVIPDVRFPNEGELIWNPQRFSLAKVSPESLLLEVCRTGVEYDPDGHESEQHVGKMGENTTVFNNGTELAPLHKQLDLILASYGIKL